MRNKRMPLVKGPPPWKTMSDEELGMIADRLGKIKDGVPFTRNELVDSLITDAKKNGYHPDRVDYNGKLIWGVSRKSDVQLLFEDKSTDKYQKLGTCGKVKRMMVEANKSGSQPHERPRRGGFKKI